MGRLRSLFPSARLSAFPGSVADFYLDEALLTTDGAVSGTISAVELCDEGCQRRAPNADGLLSARSEGAVVTYRLARELGLERELGVWSVTGPRPRMSAGDSITGENCSIGGPPNRSWALALVHRSSSGGQHSLRLPNRDETYTNDTTGPHNAVVSLLYGSGLVGLLGFLLLLVGPLSKALRYERVTAERALRAELIGVIGVLALAATFAFFSEALRAQDPALFFWAALGMLTSYVGIALCEPGAGSTRRPRLAAVRGNGTTSGTAEKPRQHGST